MLLTASVLESARALQATEVAELATPYAEYQKLETRLAQRHAEQSSGLVDGTRFMNPVLH